MASVAVDDDLHQKLKVRCSESRLKIKDMVNELIAEWLKNMRIEAIKIEQNNKYIVGNFENNRNSFW
ncbi:MAG: hypothetical protein QMD12_00190 [Candidatus Aenigmarchaeota archaeon]|nr:hypothetical protein [Candidatus Aenigmarchaeota archaeon]